jgi:hypothetical protein
MSAGLADVIVMLLVVCCSVSGFCVGACCVGVGCVGVDDSQSIFWRERSPSGSGGRQTDKFATLS